MCSSNPHSLRNHSSDVLSSDNNSLESSNSPLKLSHPTKCFASGIQNLKKAIISCVDLETGTTTWKSGAKSRNHLFLYVSHTVDALAAINCTSGASHASFHCQTCICHINRLAQTNCGYIMGLLNVGNGRRILLLLQGSCNKKDLGKNRTHIMII